MHIYKLCIFMCGLIISCCGMNDIERRINNYLTTNNISSFDKLVRKDVDSITNFLKYVAKQTDQQAIEFLLGNPQLFIALYKTGGARKKCAFALWNIFNKQLKNTIDSVNIGLIIATSLNVLSLAQHVFINKIACGKCTNCSPEKYQYYSIMVKPLLNTMKHKNGDLFSHLISDWWYWGILKPDEINEVCLIAINNHINDSDYAIKILLKIFHNHITTQTFNKLKMHYTQKITDPNELLPLISSLLIKKQPLEDDENCIIM